MLPAMLSVVIPTLNAAEVLPACLAALAPGRQSGLIEEIVVSDGGSCDGTVDVAEAAGARVVTGATGRGSQLQRGALVAGGEWFMFLHADTRLAPEWLFAVEDFVANPGNRHRAAYFRFALDDAAAAARRVERLVAWRCRRFALPYGDQGLVISRLLFAEVGGYRDLPLMEDVDLARRLGRRRLTGLPVAAVTSAARYRRDGYRRRSARNLMCLALYFCGLPPRLIRKVYG